ncbi:MAG TPA: aminotransferase class V-fold PLP-dependent enzyme, partial [bacterium]|nr:aminotransferase class V-fold PLP-dependent enzyme [bacterium]
RTMEALAREGYELTVVGCDTEGRIDPSALAAAIRPGQTALVSCMWANNETGVLLPVPEIADHCAEAGVPFHTDAVQAVGKVPVDLRAHPGINLLSLAGHKLHGPKGVGALVVRRGTALEPLVRGGAQEGGRRAGTENIAGIVGLGVACGLAHRHLAAGGPAIAALRDRFEAAVLARLSGVWRNGGGAPRTPNTTSLGFEGVEGQGVLLLLDQAGIAASAGSACAAGSLEASHVLRAMGLDHDQAGASLRFSLSRYTTAEELDWALEALVATVERLRTLRPYADPAAIAAYRQTQRLPVG